MLTVRSDRRFHLDYSQFREPSPSPETSTPHVTATLAGIARIGLKVDHLDTCEAIADTVIADSPQVTKFHESEQWDLGESQIYVCST